MQFALSVVSSGCYEDDADEGEVMTLTGQPGPSCKAIQDVALPNWTLDVTCRQSKPERPPEGLAKAHGRRDMASLQPAPTRVHP